MARPPFVEGRLDDVDPDARTIKTVLKRMPAAARVDVLTWLCLYYGSRGERFEPGGRRRRVTIDGEDFWLVRIPKRTKPYR